ncbi:response regulator [Labilibacter sediminis]|nr:response regulator [Labilibacter sediminis]
MPRKVHVHYHVKAPYSIHYMRFQYYISLSLPVAFCAPQPLVHSSDCPPKHSLDFNIQKSILFCKVSCRLIMVIKELSYFYCLKFQISMFRKILTTYQLVLIVMFACSDLLANDWNINFLSINDGLSQNEVTTITQDKFGFMWFGTRGGLNRYDGYQFKIFKPQQNQINGLKSASIERLFIDSNKKLLIGTKTGGCSVYDIPIDLFDPKEYPEDFPSRIISFLEDNNGNLWYGGWTKGLWKYDRKTDIYIPIIKNERIKSIAQAHNGTIWFSTNFGLFWLDGNVVNKVEQVGELVLNEILVDKNEPVIWYTGWGESFGKYNYEDNTHEEFCKVKNTELKIYNTYSLCQTADGKLFVGTWGEGLFIFDAKKELFESVNLHLEERNDKMDYKVILDVYEDKYGDIWLGTDGGGVVHLFQSNGFKSEIIKSKQEILQSQVNDLYIDSSERKWIATKDMGVFVSMGEEYVQVGFQQYEEYNQGSVTAKKIFEDTESNIWASLDNDIFIAKAKSSNKIEMQRPINLFSQEDLIEVKKVLDMHFSKDGVWVATQQNGLLYFKKDKGKYKKIHHYHVLNNDLFISDNRVTSILRDINKDLWISTFKGMHKFNPIDSTFVPLEQLPFGDIRPIENIVLSTCVDSNYIWYGTPGGLNRLEQTSNGVYNIRYFTKNSGLSDDYINAIQKDVHGNIWISTNSGISHINRVNETILNYALLGGYKNKRYAQGSSFQDQNGVIYFGNDNGYTYFHPDEITPSQIEPKVVFTNLKVLGEDINVSKDGILNQSINEVETIVFRSGQNDFSLEFSSLDFTSPQKNLYAYSLTRGTDTTWTYIGNKHYLSFKNLRSGKYLLLVKGTNASGEWSRHEKSVRLIILPPIWQTWYALLLYALVLLGIIMLINWNQRKQNNLRSKIEKEQLEREKDQQLIEYKIKFFTNMSHELRTPLSLISAPITELISNDITAKPIDYLMSKLVLVQKNVRRLENLVNEIIEFRKVDTGNVELNFSEVDIVAFIKEIKEKFVELAAEREVTFETDFSVKEQFLFIDIERIEIVLSNLLSNAFKFCAKPGKVILSLDVPDDGVVIKIINDGKGIAESDMKHLFDRFYQGGTNTSVRSSGIGLNLVKEYIELHKGTVEAESEVDGLTTFTIRIKLGSDHLDAKSIVRKPNSNMMKTIDVDMEVQGVKTKSVNTKGRGSRIVIIEDNDELRNYLSELLSRQYSVATEKDGVLGYETIINEKPDLVISDVMMPNMDGYELCEKVKTNLSTEHIPVLLLTAKNMTEDELIGLKKGADLYITKPFNPEVLQEQVRMLISSRKKLKEKFAKNVKLEASKLNITNQEGEIITKVINIIEGNLDNPSLDADTLAHQLSMSGSTFYRRIKKLTKLSPHEFIISIKMKAAARFLTESGNTVTEIAGKLGYNDVNTFRRNFGDYYGTTPSKYRKEK